ncbi:hypothetical protein RIR_jg24849.t1 [Rhizophagus irregularis DAOM 181602=DAOM 197198]|nr:hypothetical protein RIR_jg24849.t1 [Rhizophagus irregularis DAOM 181602=DAOM 197198]
MKDCLDSGIENDADLNILRFNGFMSTQWTLYDRSHLKNVYDDPYRVRGIFANHLILYTLVRRNETVIGAVWQVRS